MKLLLIGSKITQTQKDKYRSFIYIYVCMYISYDLQLKEGIIKAVEEECNKECREILIKYSTRGKYSQHPL